MIVQLRTQNRHPSLNHRAGSSLLISVFTSGKGEAQTHFGFPKWLGHRRSSPACRFFLTEFAALEPPICWAMMGRIPHLLKSLPLLAGSYYWGPNAHVSSRVKTYHMEIAAAFFLNAILSAGRVKATAAAGGRARSV
jgi:hypothetical protein